MANAWAFSAFWAGLAFIAKLLAMEFKVLTEPPEIAVGSVARLFEASPLAMAVCTAPTSRINFLAARESHYNGTARQDDAQLQINVLSCRGSAV